MCVWIVGKRGARLKSEREAYKASKFRGADDSESSEDSDKSFDEYASVLGDHFTRWAPEDRYVSLHVEKKIRCNWKVAMEAFIESYHAIQTHPQILSFTGGDNSQYDVFGEHLSRTITPQGIPNPGQADRFSVRESVEAMTGPEGFEQALALTGKSAEADHTPSQCSTRTLQRRR